MTGDAKVKFDLLNGVQKIFAFSVRGTGYTHIENQIAEFAQKKINQYKRKIKGLSWEVKFTED
tara:strand:+ start:364 stop:552 length:189 start_codon:yes stop_codon:yes gene_type:complete